jgi:sulfotransferase family protein
MLIWVASYPRSGNALARTILKRCFGADSHSVYPHDDGAGELAALTGTRGFDGPLEAMLEAARTAPQPWFVKTHRMEASDERMLYIVRDGRAAMASYRRFQRNINGLDFPLEQFVLGAEPIESWRDHVEWGMDRKATLVLRYEDMIRPDRDLLERIADFIGLPVLRPFDVSFAQLRALDPRLFGTGRNAPGIDAVEAVCPALFWLVNGETMRALGYADRARHWSVYLVRQAMIEMTRHVAARTATLRNLEGAAPGSRAASP